MKIYVIASTEYEANMPDLFLMDEKGNYYGVSEHSYAIWHKFPKSIDFWRNAEGSDDGRYFNIDEVELDAAQVQKFDQLTKEYAKLDAETPDFSEQYPAPSSFKTKKAYNQAVKDYMARYEEWVKVSNIRYYISTKQNLWSERTRLFCSFSKNVYEAIKDNDPIKR